MSKRVSNKRVKAMIERSFNDKAYKLGCQYYPPFSFYENDGLCDDRGEPVELYDVSSLTANQMKGKQ